MSREGRIEGRKSADGAFYELWQYGEVRQSITIAQVHADSRLQAAIVKNKWESL